MRPLPLVAGFVLLLPLLPLTSAAPPSLTIVLLPTDEFLAPGRVERIDGHLRIDFPADANCPEGLPYGFSVANRTAGLTVRVLSANGTLPASQIRAGGNASLPLQLELEFGMDVVAYSRVETQVRAATSACGNLQAAQALGQTGARALFVPRVNLTLKEETANAWRVRADNEGNARVRLEWRLLHPSPYRVVSGGVATVPGPEPSGSDGAPRPVVERTADFLIARARINESRTLHVVSDIIYDGEYPYRPDERPETGETMFVLYEPPPGAGVRAALVQYGLLGLAILLIVGGAAAAWFLKRRRRKD